MQFSNLFLILAVTAQSEETPVKKDQMGAATEDKMGAAKEDKMGAATEKGPSAENKEVTMLLAEVESPYGLKSADFDAETLVGLEANEKSGVLNSAVQESAEASDTATKVANLAWLKYKANMMHPMTTKEAATQMADDLVQNLMWLTKQQANFNEVKGLVATHNAKHGESEADALGAPPKSEEELKKELKALKEKAEKEKEVEPNAKGKNMMEENKEGPKKDVEKKEEKKDAEKKDVEKKDMEKEEPKKEDPKKNMASFEDSADAEAEDAAGDAAVSSSGLFLVVPLLSFLL